jgi:hypothetical protein
VALPGGHAERTLRQLRLGSPAVIGRVENGAVVLDLRTVETAWDEALPGAVARALGGQAAEPEPQPGPR